MDSVATGRTARFETRIEARSITAQEGRAAATGQELRICLLGGFSVSTDMRVVDEGDWYLRKAKSLVKLLALAPEHRLHRGQIIDILWPELELEAGTNNLHKVLHIARRTLEPNLPSKRPSSYLRMRGDLVFLDHDAPVWIDVEAFRTAAKAAQFSQDPAVLRHALSLYGGDLLPEDRYEEWVIRHREQLSEMRVALLLQLARLHERRDEIEAAITALREIVAGDQAHEEAQASLMRLLANSGYRQQALRQYQQLRNALRAELEVEPDPGVTRLYEEILRGKPAPGAEVLATTASTHPTFSAGVAERSSLVGRVAEMEWLQNVVNDIFVGRGSVVLISGDAGIGKSRLAAELMEEAEGRGAITLWGASYKSGKELPYGLFTRALEGFALRINPEMLETLLGDSAPELARLVPAIAMTTGLNHGTPAFGGPTDRARIFTAVWDFFSQLAEYGPVVVVLEDLQAADQESLLLLESLARTVQQARILFLCTFRGGEVATGSAVDNLHEELRRQQPSQVLQLKPLTIDESELLVARLMDGPVDGVVLETVQRLAGGNPHYMEEVALALRGRRRVAQVDGVWRLRKGIEVRWGRDQLRSRRDTSGDYRLGARLRA